MCLSVIRNSNSNAILFLMSFTASCSLLFIDDLRDAYKKYVKKPLNVSPAIGTRRFQSLLKTKQVFFFTGYIFI